MTPSDPALLEDWRTRRDAEAFNEIVSRHADMVFATCKRILGNEADAEDVAQECFLQLARGAGEVRTSLAGWLHCLARHRSLDWKKRELRRRRREELHARLAAGPRGSGWEAVRPWVDEAIDAL
ncbi:MAG: RNA polymerase sigma factor, partial [Thermoanaerobaculia bacterium]